MPRMYPFTRPHNDIRAVDKPIQSFTPVVRAHACRCMGRSGESDGASGRQLSRAATAFDVDCGVVSWIGADVDAFAADT